MKKKLDKRQKGSGTEKQKLDRKARLLKTKQLIASEKKGDALIRAQHVRGTDIRSISRVTQTEKFSASVVAGVTPCTRIVAFVNDRSVSYLAMGIVLRSIKKGLLAQQVSTPVPYYSFVYLVQAFKNAMQGTVPTIQTAPRWFWEICYALKKKVSAFKTGEVAYEWQINDTGQGDNQNFELGVGEDAYSIFWGTTGTGITVDGFPAWGADAPYTDALGAGAISALFNLYEGVGLGTQVGDPGLNAYMYKDTSSYAVVFPELGQSFFSPGGARSTIYSERQIDSPMFSKFAEYQPPGTALWRGWQKAGVTGCSSSYIGPRISEIERMGLIRDKLPPTPKFFNFDEFFEVLSLIMCLASEALLTFGQPVVPCPLTSQQVQILLRQVMLPGFCNDMCQDLVLGGPEFVDLLPFTVGPNGVSTGKVTMNIPTFIAENIRACCRVTATLDKKGGGASDNNQIDLLPVLCRPSIRTHPQLGNYLYGPANIPLYAINLTETFINLIDCSAMSGSSVVYLDLSRNTLHDIANQWNEWILHYTAVLSPLCSPNSEHGIRAVNTLLYTNHDQEAPDSVPRPVAANLPVTNTKLSRQPSKSKVMGMDVLWMKRKLGAIPDPASPVYFTNVSDKETTAQLSFNPSLWNVLSLWNLPLAYSNGQVQDASPQGWQTFIIEPYKLPRSNVGGLGGIPESGSLWPSALQRHNDMAVVDVKAFATTSQNNELISELLKLAELGRGGFFTNIASMLGDAIGVPQIGQVAKVVGQFTGL